MSQAFWLQSAPLISLLRLLTSKNLNGLLIQPEPRTDQKRRALLCNTAYFYKPNKQGFLSIYPVPESHFFLIF